MLAIVLFAAALVGARLPGASAQVPVVDVELVIAVDVSGSMGDDEHALQRDGFLAAFADPQLIQAIRSGPNGAIAVTYVEWAGEHSQAVLVPWMIVRDEATAEAFRQTLSTKPRTPLRGTSISGALNFAERQLGDSPFPGLRRVVDVSGDGPNRTGPAVDQVRDRLVAGGIVINGLPIMLSPMLQRGFDGAGLDQYFTDCVIGGPGAFVLPVTETEQMVEAIRRKLILEVSALTPRMIPIADTPPGKVDCRIGRSYRNDW